MAKYILKLIYYNLWALLVVYLATALTHVPFRWWIVIAGTSSSYVVHHYLEKKHNR